MMMGIMASMKILPMESITMVTDWSMKIRLEVLTLPVEFNIPGQFFLIPQKRETAIKNGPFTGKLIWV
jgi:hypothetical protein